MSPNLIMTSGSLKEKVLQTIKEKISVIVFCGDKSRHQEAHKHPLVKGVVDNASDLLKAIETVLSY